MSVVKLVDRGPHVMWTAQKFGHTAQQRSPSPAAAYQPRRVFSWPWGVGAGRRWAGGRQERSKGDDERFPR